MKTKEELNALKEEVETLNRKLHELTEEELSQVSGGDCSETDYAELESMIADANRKVGMAIAYAQKTAKDDVNELLEKIEKTIAPVFKFAAGIGVEVVGEINYYRIDGRMIAIDQLKAIRK